MKNHPYWQEATEYLINKDKKLAQLITTHKNLKFICNEDAFQTLIRSIVGQQISVQAAATVWNRILQGVESIHFKNFLQITEENAKQFGLSAQKKKYIINIAQHFQNKNIIDRSYWKNRAFKDIQKELIQIQGIGVWTVQMFGIFYLLEPDILPTKDIGLIRAIQNIYGSTKKLKIVEIEKLAHKWRPWRSIATFFLWKSVNTNLITY